jgi:hypothetical protein
MTEQPPGPPPGSAPPPPPPPGGYPPPPSQSGGVALPPPPGAATPPGRFLVWGIVAVICCLPLGIVSIVKAGKVSRLWAEGRYAEAHEASDDAKKWAIWSAIAGAVVVLVAFVVFVGLGSGSS